MGCYRDAFSHAQHKEGQGPLEPSIEADISDSDISACCFDHPENNGPDLDYLSSCIPSLNPVP